MPKSAVVGITIGDWRQFPALAYGIARALERFGEIGEADMAALPEAVREGIASLRDGAAKAAGIVPEQPPGLPHPVIIEWPKKERGVALPGWGISITDAETGEPVNTVNKMAVTLLADAEDIIRADLTMFADEDGSPVTSASRAYLKDGEVIMRPFRAIVSEMRVREVSGAPQSPQAETPA